MDLYEAIDKRRTVRDLTKGITEEQLRKLLLVGVKAPSGSNEQPWEFIVLDDTAIIEQLAELKYRQTLKMRIDEIARDKPEMLEQLYTQTGEPQKTTWILRQKENYLNSTVIAVCNEKWHGSGRKPWMTTENIASAWMCVQNICLAATAEGLGTQISIFREEYRFEAEKLLGIPESCELTTVLLIGEIGKHPGTERNNLRPDFSWLHRNRFGNIGQVRGSNFTGNKKYPW